VRVDGGGAFAWEGEEGGLRKKRELRQQSKARALGPEAVKIVEAVTKRTVAKLLHEPTVRVKEAAGSPGGERLAEALRNLFDL